ncbi:MAG: hypothetical protein EP297_14510 [Gammaproteobacteria bacterium]|nr:MAG: hypothetical protein EP297_14510 [Gammaproteobacteria bacterium]
MIRSEILVLIENHARLFKSVIHGLPHWKTVERNGLYLAQHTGADPNVVSYFAYFHDCMRVNEDHDPEHGPRATAFIKEYRHLLDLTGDQLDMLCRACSGHTHGMKCHDSTVCTCWDADRLDIGRIGVKPNSKYLFNDEAKRIADEQDEMTLIRYGFIKDIY